MEEPTPDQIRVEFLLYRKSCHETLGQFLANYHRRWLEASRFNIDGMDAIIHLIPLLPCEWQDSISLIPTYIDRTLLGSFYGDLEGFIGTLSHRYFDHEAPPPVPVFVPQKIDNEVNNNDEHNDDPMRQAHDGTQGEAVQNVVDGEVVSGAAMEREVTSNGVRATVVEEVAGVDIEVDGHSNEVLENGYVNNEPSEEEEPSEGTVASEASSAGADV